MTFGRDATGQAQLSGVAISELLQASRAGTPAYIYDLSAIATEAKKLKATFGAAPHVLAYAIKANSAGSVLRTLAEEGCGADVVSGAELEVALACGIPPGRIVMSGVAKTDAEIDLCIKTGILSIQVESGEELHRVRARAVALGTPANLTIRINPGVSIDTHKHIATGHDEAKFGVPRNEIHSLWDEIDKAPDALVPVGLSVHVGSMLRPADYLKSARVVCELARHRLNSKPLELINFGGGFGIDYGQHPCQPPSDFVRAALDLQKSQGLAPLTLVVEPGRSLVGPHGVLVARVIQQKQSGQGRFLMIDAGMNDLMRPALYGAEHRIESLRESPGSTSYRVVGPVCESSDDFGIHFFGEQTPDYVVIRDAGAYGFVMSSEYNGRALPAEVFVADGQVLHVSNSPGAERWINSRLRA